MIVTKVRELKSCISININRVTYKINKQTYLEYGLFDGKEISEITFEELKSRDTYISCFDYLTKLIASSLHSELMLKMKAINKGYKEETVNKAIDSLKEYGYQNDLNNIKELILLYISYVKSNNEIALLLLNKGYMEDEVISSLKEYENEEDRIKLSYESYIKRHNEDITSIEFQKKIINYLLNKGYDYIGIQKVTGIYYGDFD